MRAEALTGPVLDHGEGPVYSPRCAGPRMVDMLAGDICELQPSGHLLRHHVGAVAAMLRPRTGPGHVIAGERGLLLTEHDRLTAPTTPALDLVSDPAARLNEGGCDPDGNLYIGSMAYDQHAGGGKLWRCDPEGRATVVLDDVSISNGIGWSPDRTVAYYVDTPTSRIDVFDWSTSEGLTNPRTFATVDGPGQPDGLTVDSEGGVWVALFGGSAVLRYLPSGRLDDVVELPTSQVTAVTFTGDQLDQLLITTSRYGMETHPEPEAGALFTAQPHIRGLPCPTYG